ncbi:MAG TPA: T9SS type A sorting domain-containing protein, partial [Ignavibacteriaceae bacterium]|nr:T9SS type A sorting domain-containing protein [Ignavibacteriaceae bacterium]
FERIDNLEFGLHGDISAPKAGQSIGINPYEGDEYVLDNTPTIGSPNDTTNITGSVKGYIKDSLGYAIPGVSVIYDYGSDDGTGFPWYNSVITDSLGFYFFHEVSKRARLQFEKEGFYRPDTSIQIWPDSTVTINVSMSHVVGVTEIKPAALNKFELTQNFPNPFNSSTSFYYFLPEDEDVEIIIYDQKGEMVQKLFKGFQSKGQYRINWNANEIASGIYFYELKAGSRNLVKKCLLLK